MYYLALSEKLINDHKQNINNFILPLNWKEKGKVSAGE